MRKVLSIISDYLAGRSIYKPAIKILDFAVSIFISSKIFEALYFHYQLLDISDYESLSLFFLSGRFVVPLILFVAVWRFLNFFLKIIFMLGVLRVKENYLRKIENFRLGEDEKLQFRYTNECPGIYPVQNYSPFFKYYLISREIIMAFNHKKIEASFESGKENMLNNFKLGFKILIVIISSFMSVPFFGWKLFLISTLAIILALLFFFLSYIFLEVIPNAIKKFDREILLPNS